MFKILKYQLYLLQLESYEIGRYLRLLFKRGLWPAGNLRKQLVWTVKAKSLFLMASGLYVIIPLTIITLWIPASAGMTWKLFLLFALYCVLFFLFFIFYILSLIFVWPLDFLVKKIIIAKAKTKIKSLKDLKIVGIAGSYGKTTMKEVVRAVLSTQYTVLSTPESVNTPVGIARWILKNVDKSVDIIAVEMGEHYKGDVKYLCEITPPDISIVTGINEAHLERMKKMESVVSTIFEIVSKTKSKGMVVLNGDDENVIKNYKQYVQPDHSLEFFGKKSTSSKFNEQGLLWEAEVKDIGKVNIHLLGEYALSDIQAAITIAKYLNIKNEDIKRGIEKIRPVPHRLQPVESEGGVLVIDDAYNGNSKGVEEAIKVLSRFKSRRKIYITPGLVESGEKSAEVHRAIGRQLSEVADVVILIRNSVTPFIAKEFEKEKKPEIIWFNTAQEAYASLKEILKQGDVVMFQNDWGDQYI